MFGRSTKSKKEEDLSSNGTRDISMETDRTLTEGPTTAQLKRATRTRLGWSLFASFLLVLTVIFLILVEVGQTDMSQGTLNKIYFIRLDLSNIFPTSVPNAAIINSIAQTIGLHDFYTVGLWNFCEGYDTVTRCSSPKALYWFDPVSIILDELLSGATITLPTELTSILDLIRIVSHWMFGLFLTGACLSFVMIFLQPVAVYSRWWAMFVMIFTFLAALFTTVATVIATVLFMIMRNALTSVADLHIGANLGTRMFVFMWISAGTSIIAFIIQLCLCCCCASRRDVKTGRKRGNKHAWESSEIAAADAAAAAPSEKPARSGMFSRNAIFGKKSQVDA